MAERVLRLSTYGRMGWRKDLDVLSIGVADFPPLRVCQVNVTRITRKVFKILNLVYGNPSFFCGRYTVPFLRTWNPAQNWRRQTGPLIRKVVAKLTTAAHDLVAKNIFWSQMATRRPGFFQPWESSDIERSIAISY